MSGANYPFDRYLQNYYVLYNLINTKLYDSKVFNVQMIMQQLSGIDNPVASKELKSVRYYNLQGMGSNEPFKGFNIRVTTWSDGSRTTEKIIK